MWLCIKFRYVPNVYYYVHIMNNIAYQETCVDILTYDPIVFIGEA